MGKWKIDCKDILTWCEEYDGPKFHAMLCDPPYELGFMGKDWDKSGIAFNPKTWEALKEHLLPGAFIFVFGSSRGWHRLAVAIEDAGFVFHPSIMMWGWVQGQGFCKATRIDTQVDKAAGIEREKVVNKRVVERYPNGPKGNQFSIGQGPDGSRNGVPMKELPATPLARAWEGHRYGRQALRPLVEMIICAQVPYKGKPFECITETGAGALWVEGARVRTDNNLGRPLSRKSRFSPIALQASPVGAGSINEDWKGGRWPPNFGLVHSPGCRMVGTKRVEGYQINRWMDGSKPFGGGAGHPYETEQCGDVDGLETVDVWDCVKECAVHRLGRQSGESKSPSPYIQKTRVKGNVYGLGSMNDKEGKMSTHHGDEGTAARFFPQFDWALEVFEQLTNSDQVYYCAKAGRGERDAGLEEWELGPSFDKNTSKMIRRSNPDTGAVREFEFRPSQRHNPHPTVKPITLARWLATLLLPPPEYSPRRLLIPFAGVMSEAIGAMLAGWEEIVGVEMEEEYCEIGNARMKFWSQVESYEQAMSVAKQVKQDLKEQKDEDESGRLRLW